jgi:hypothetical protein
MSTCAPCLCYLHQNRGSLVDMLLLLCAARVRQVSDGYFAGSIRGFSPMYDAGESLIVSKDCQVRCIYSLWLMVSRF